MNLAFKHMPKKQAWVIVLPVLFCLILFREAIFTHKTLFHMDWAPYFPRSNWIGPWQHFVVDHAPFSLMHIMKACLPLRFYHVAFYFVAICGTVWATYGYLRDRALSMGAAFLGGVAFGFSGYCVSLVSAGHRGVFEACLCAAVLLFVGARAIRRGAWFYYCFSALAIALVLGTQPDVFLILLFVVGPLLLVDFFHELRKRPDAYARKLSVGLLVFCITLIIVGWRGVEKIVTSYLPGRETLIKQVGGSVQGDGGEEKWIFCTNWSLPPSDCVELAVPLVLGVESTDRKYPFWGKLGRSYGWGPGKPGFPNYRQHTIYAGAMQLILAFYTVLVLFRRSRSINLPDRGLLSVAATLVVATFVLALGRYTPVYRLFYALPLANSIRCPVKFLHATNLAGALLCAFGAQIVSERLSTKHSSKRLTALLYEPEGIVLLCVLAILMALVSVKALLGGGCATLSHAWSALGFSSGIQVRLLAQLNWGLMHAMLIFSLAGIPFLFVVRAWGGRQIAWVGWALAFVVAVDMTSVNVHYVNTLDLSLQEMKNVIVEDMIAGKDYKPRVLDLITGWEKHNPMRANLEGYYSQDIVLVDKEQRNNPEFVAALKQGVDRMSQAFQDTEVEYIVTSSRLAQQLQSLEGYAPIASYDFDGKCCYRAGENRGSVVVLAER